MDILKIAIMYKGHKFNDRISPEKKKMLDSIVLSASENHLELLECLIFDIETCWVGHHKKNNLKELKSQIREFKEWLSLQSDQDPETSTDLKTINNIINKGK